jgi:hypothetical protein
MSILPKHLPVLIAGVSFENDMLQVSLSDGREIRVPLEWFPKLRDAAPEQRQHWRLIGRGRRRIGPIWTKIYLWKDC